MSPEAAALMIVTLQDLQSLERRLGDQLDELGRDLSAKLDTLGTRVGAIDVARGELGVKVTNLERETFRRKADRRRGSGDGDDPGGDRRITERDVRTFALGAGAVLALLKGLPWLASAVRVLLAAPP